MSVDQRKIMDNFPKFHCHLEKMILVIVGTKKCVPGTDPNTHVLVYGHRYDPISTVCGPLIKRRGQVKFW